MLTQSKNMILFQVSLKYQLPDSSKILYVQIRQCGRKSCPLNVGGWFQLDWVTLRQKSGTKSQSFTAMETDSG